MRLKTLTPALWSGRVHRALFAKLAANSARHVLRAPIPRAVFLRASASSRRRPSARQTRHRDRNPARGVDIGQQRMQRRAGNFGFVAEPRKCSMTCAWVTSKSWSRINAATRHARRRRRIVVATACRIAPPARFQQHARDDLRASPPVRICGVAPARRARGRAGFAKKACSPVRRPAALALRSGAPCRPRLAPRHCRLQSESSAGSPPHPARQVGEFSLQHHASAGAVICESSGLANVSKRARPSSLLRSTCADSSSNRNADSGLAFFEFGKKRFLAEPRARRYPGRLPAAGTGSAHPCRRQAPAAIVPARARRRCGPALSPSKQNTRLSAMRNSFCTCVGVVAVPSVATAFSTPFCASATTSM